MKFEKQKKILKASMTKFILLLILFAILLDFINLNLTLLKKL